MFASVEQVRALLSQGKPLILAGEESLLAKLPKGNWIGGTIPYFMTAEGGKTSREQIFVEQAPPFSQGFRTTVYDVDTIRRIGDDSPDNGYTIVIMPAFTPLHQQYALEAPRFPELFLKVVAGWVAGIHLDDVGKRTPKVFDGARGEVIADRAVAMHVDLPRSHQAQIAIVNIFEPGEGDEIRFLESGFSAAECLINGERRNFQEYFSRNKLDSRLPLVANYCGAMINVSLRELDAAARRATFYAPVFAGVPYRLARPVGDYADRFASALAAQSVAPVFSCNCVLNYLYGQLECRHTGNILGPMTFGEIAYQLLNQTLVHVTVAPADNTIS